MSALGDGFVHVVGDPAAHLLEHARHQRGGAAQGHPRAQLDQRPDVRAGHAAVKNVAQDGDVQPGDAALLFADGEDVQQRLGGMLVRAVAGVDDAGVEEARQEMRRAGGAVADDDDVGVERSRLRAVSLSVSPFLSEEASAVKLMMSARQALRGEFETDARARGRLDEEVDDGLAAQGGDLLDGALADGFEGAGGVEHRDDFLRREGFDVEQMFALPAHCSSPDDTSSPCVRTGQLATLIFSLWRGRHILADEIGLDGQFAVAAVDEHGQLNPARPAKIIQGVHGGADSAAAEKHVIHQHDRFAGDIERDHRWDGLSGAAAGPDRRGAC